MRSRRNIVLQIMLIAAFFLVIINCSDDGAPTQIQDDDSVPAGKYLAISNEVVSEPNTTGNFRTVTFDISCENSGQTPYTAGSWDAAWIFIKYNDGDGE
ncbi:MAG: hypothetical protein GY863_23730, partial [bacterium]|nr:hypothetical protein [bacterium]